MYDSIHFWIDRTQGVNLDEVVNRLDAARETTDRNTGEVWTYGNLANLKATISMAGVSIKGSLAKYYFPNNAYTLNRYQVKEAIDKLSDDLGLPINSARITRIDVSTNFMMTHPTHRYFDVLGMCRYYNRIQATNSTLYYQMKGLDCKRTMVFYDKERESQANHISLPNVFAESNLLRYESRWNKRLPQQFKETQVIGATLYDRQFYNKALHGWANNYFSINKKQKLKFEAMDNIKNVSDAVNYVCAFAIGRLPPDEIQELLEELKANKVFNNRTYYTRLRQKIKQLSTNTKIMEADDLVKELDDEVKNVLAYMR
jgi:hypothetical protein